MTEGAPSVVVVGSLNADLVVRMERFPAPGQTLTGTDFHVYPGGKGANQACAASRLGARVALVGRVGADDNGRMLQTSLQAAGVDLTHVLEDPEAPTGTAVISIDATGQNQIVIVSGANGRVSTGDVDRARGLFVPGVLVLLQLEIPFETVAHAVERAREAGATVILDPAPARADALRLLGLVDVVTPNESELAALLGEAPAADESAALRQARALVVRGARCVITKLGGRGACLVARDRERRFVAPAVKAVDTTAAGDVWNGAFARALARGGGEDDAGRYATEAAALSVTRAGAQPSMPTDGELADWLAARKQ
jgi:ribokinase